MGVRSLNLGRLTEWLYRRVVCPSCGEENKDKLPIYIAAELDYMRVDACDSCQTYLKSVDLTKTDEPCRWWMRSRQWR
jgi:formate dehydrogenase maturation protein FdhE